MPTLGPTELVVILVIVIVLFGANRVGEVIGSLGRGVRQFKAEMREDAPTKKGSSGDVA